MRKTDHDQINTRTYWNQVYGTPDKRAGYAAQGTDVGHCHGQAAVKTSRFTTTLKYVNPFDKFLDIGCGVGVMTSLVKERYPMCEVWGTDISDRAIEDNKREQPGITYLHQYVGHQDGVPSDYFDVVFSGETLEHLDDPNDLFKDAARVLKPGGTFVLTTPNEENIRSPEHTWIFTREDIASLYTNNGFASPTFVYLPDMEHLLVIYAVGKKL